MIITVLSLMVGSRPFSPAEDLAVTVQRLSGWMM
jgi:hypothetical protein